MASSPIWKVYTAEREYVAAAKNPVLAAMVVANLGDGATIRYGHSKVVWTEGTDGQAGESYDVVAETCQTRAPRPWPGH